MRICLDFFLHTTLTRAMLPTPVPLSIPASLSLAHLIHKKERDSTKLVQRSFYRGNEISPTSLKVIWFGYVAQLSKGRVAVFFVQDTTCHLTCRERMGNNVFAYSDFILQIPTYPSHFFLLLSYPQHSIP
jgi:hypothetical protein